MKNLILITFLTCTLFSCSKDIIDKKFDLEEYPQKWQLIKMTGQIPSSEKTGIDMEWQEFYLLNSNGTFIKSREQNGLVSEESGTFSLEESNNEKHLVLFYDFDNALIGSCYSSELKEELVLKSDNSLFSTWSACDGPGLEYERME